MKTEEVWQFPPGVPMPDMVFINEKAYHADGMTPFEPTDEQMRAAGYKKMRRQVSEWEEVDD